MTSVGLKLLDLEFGILPDMREVHMDNINLYYPILQIYIIFFQLFSFESFLDRKLPDQKIKLIFCADEISATFFTIVISDHWTDDKTETIKKRK